MNRNSWTPPLTQDPARLQPWNLQPETQLGWSTDPIDLAMLVNGFDPISLQEMDEVALLNRVDTKFLMTNRQLLDVLAALQMDYWVLSVKGTRLNHYRTLYFDTPDFLLYTLHVNGRAERYKVRSREYTDSKVSFLEVKHKTRKDRTIKDRLSTPQQVTDLTPESEAWLESICPLDGSSLEPRLWNTFTRITLVSKQLCERVTLDVNLTFYNETHQAHVGGLVIAEIKMDAHNPISPFQAQMRMRHIHPHGFSKYCFGVSQLYDTVKRNTIKSKKLMIERMIGGISCE